MGFGSLKDLYLDELALLYDAELQVTRALARLSEAAHKPVLRETLAHESRKALFHLERIELIFTHWDERRPLRTSAGLAGIVQEADERLNQETTPDARDTAIIAIAQRIAHYEMAVYGSVRACALRLNRWDEARLLQETLDDEGRADNRLSSIADATLVDYVTAGFVPGRPA
jgi:ferritin-like metal-binding protein YciE